MLVVVAMVACAPVEEAQESTVEPEPKLDQAAFRAAIDTMRADFVEAAASGNWETAASILDPEVVMVVPGGEDWAAIKSASELPYPPGTILDLKPIEVRQLSPDWGYEFGTNVVTWTPEGADDPTTLSDTYLVLFRRVDDGWKLYREVASASALP
jgi:ketosteroid isomerase-like protein